MAVVPQPLEEREKRGADLRFVISRLSSLGDVVCSLPAASALKRGHPGCHITWVVGDRFADVVRSCSAVDEVVLRGAAPEGDFDAALDLQGLLKSALVLARVKAKQKVGYHWQREGSALFSERVMPDPSSIHVVDQYVDVARAVGGEADRADFALAPSAEGLGSVQSKLGSIKEGFVVINPGAAWASKRWPAESCAKLVDALPLPAVLIGSKGETSAQEVAKLCSKAPLNLSGQTSIAELIALVSLASAHIGGDTGSTHIAAALGIPAVGLYSATRPERTCPYGQITRCHYNAGGLKHVRPEAVIQTVLEALN